MIECLNNLIIKQAGTELGQAQIKMGIDCIQNCCIKQAKYNTGLFGCHQPKPANDENIMDITSKYLTANRVKFFDNLSIHS